MSLTLTRERVAETVAQYVYPRPITFDEWLETGDREAPTNLVNGTPVEQPMVQLQHEKFNLWLLVVLVQYARRAGLGAVLGTRSPVQTSQFGGRLPDLFFVRREREHLITQKATRGAPDLVLGIVSPNDRKSDINATEADYQTLGVDEIVYVDLPRLRMRVLHKVETGYEEQTLSGLTLQWDWLFVEPRPDEMDTVLSMLAAR